MIAVMLVDNHAGAREGCRQLLEHSGEFIVTGEADDAQSAYIQYCHDAPEVVVMEIALPGASGIDVMTRILGRQPAARVLMFSRYQDQLVAERAIRAGAKGYVAKTSAPGILLQAVRAVARGKQYVSLGSGRHVDCDLLQVPDRTVDELTDREPEALRLLAQGEPLDEIARLLSLSRTTVSNYQTSIRGQVGRGFIVAVIRDREANRNHLCIAMRRRSAVSR